MTLLPGKVLHLLAGHPQERIAGSLLLQLAARMGLRTVDASRILLCRHREHTGRVRELMAAASKSVAPANVQTRGASGPKPSRGTVLDQDNRDRLPAAR